MLCPGGKERMRRLMAGIASSSLDLKPLVTHRFKLDDSEAAYGLFGHQRDGLLNVAIKPGSGLLPSIPAGLFRFLSRGTGHRPVVTLSDQAGPPSSGRTCMW
jgi:hypothetical protein